MNLAAIIKEIKFLLTNEIDKKTVLKLIELHLKLQETLKSVKMKTDLSKRISLLSQELLSISKTELTIETLHKICCSLEPKSETNARPVELSDIINYASRLNKTPIPLDLHLSNSLLFQQNIQDKATIEGAVEKHESNYEISFDHSAQQLEPEMLDLDLF
jgi:hypothetical protein